MAYRYPLPKAGAGAAVVANPRRASPAGKAERLAETLAAVTPVGARVKIKEVFLPGQPPRYMPALFNVTTQQQLKDFADALESFGSVGYDTARRAVRMLEKRVGWTRRLSGSFGGDSAVRLQNPPSRKLSPRRNPLTRGEAREVRAKADAAHARYLDVRGVDHAAAEWHRGRSAAHREDADTYSSRRNPGADAPTDAGPEQFTVYLLTPGRPPNRVSSWGNMQGAKRAIQKLPDIWPPTQIRVWDDRERKWGGAVSHHQNPTRGRRRNPGLVEQIRPGDLVTIVNRFGQQRRGRAVMPSSHGGWVLNMGGPHGTPGLADESNIVKVQKSKARHGGGSVPPQPRGNPGVKGWRTVDTGGGTSALYWRAPDGTHLTANDAEHDTPPRPGRAVNVAHFPASADTIAGGPPLHYAEHVTASAFRARTPAGWWAALRAGRQNPKRRGVRRPATPEQHRLAIAKRTVRMAPAMRGVMGGPSLEEAKRTIAAAKTGRRRNPGPRRGSKLDPFQVNISKRMVKAGRAAADAMGFSWSFDYARQVVGADIEEREHNVSTEAAWKIAGDHLDADPEYYDKRRNPRGRRNPGRAPVVPAKLKAGGIRVVWLPANQAWMVMWKNQRLRGPIPRDEVVEYLRDVERGRVTNPLTKAESHRVAGFAREASRESKRVTLPTNRSFLRGQAQAYGHVVQRFGSTRGRRTNPPPVLITLNPGETGNRATQLWRKFHGPQARGTGNPKVTRARGGSGSGRATIIHLGGAKELKLRDHPVLKLHGYTAYASPNGRRCFLAKGVPKFGVKAQFVGMGQHVTYSGPRYSRAKRPGGHPTWWKHDFAGGVRVFRTAGSNPTYVVEGGKFRVTDWMRG